MIAIDNQSLLSIWETAGEMQPTLRSLHLLSRLYPNADFQSSTVGECNRQLMLLRKELFGDPFDAITLCPHCGEKTEVEFTVTGFLMATSTNTEGAQTRSIQQSNFGDYQLKWNLPTAADVASLAEFTDLDSARQSLLQRCLVEVNDDRHQFDDKDWPAELVAFLSSEMDRLDPFADPNLDLGCPNCNFQWQATFDIGQYLWIEIDTYVRQLLREIHLLARAYGWSESSILALSPFRRSYYLELISA
jgi:hypothetical protein